MVSTMLNKVVAMAVPVNLFHTAESHTSQCELLFSTFLRVLWIEATLFRNSWAAGSSRGSTPLWQFTTWPTQAPSAGLGGAAAGQVARTHGTFEPEMLK